MKTGILVDYLGLERNPKQQVRGRLHILLGWHDQEHHLLFRLHTG